MVQLLLVQLVQLFVLIFTLPVIIGGEVLNQKWVTTAGEAIIPVNRIRADCMNAPFQTSEGHVFADGQYIDIEVVLPNGYSDCTPQNSMFVKNVMLMTALHLTRCYNNSACAQIEWSSSDLGYSCTDDTHNRNIDSLIQLQFDVYCEPANSPAVTDITTNTEVPRNQQLCADSSLITAQHTFILSTCPKLLKVEDAVQNEMKRLVDSLNECKAECTSVDISGYDLEQPVCTSGETITSLGVYWACNTGPATTSQRQGELTTDHSKSDSTSAQIKPTVPQSEYRETAHPSHAVSGTQPGDKDRQNGDSYYLTVLIVVTVVLGVIIILLVAVIACLLRGRVRTRNRRGRVGNDPPSKQALYSRVSACSSLHSTGVSLLRYTSSNKFKEAAGEISPDTEYAVPLEQEEDNYEQTDESQYEMVDTALMRGKQQSDAESSAAIYANTYMTPVLSNVNTPNRSNTQKYSNGYLLPAASKIA